MCNIIGTPPRIQEQRWDSVSPWPWILFDVFFVKGIYFLSVSSYSKSPKISDLKFVLVICIEYIYLYIFVCYN